MKTLVSIAFTLALAVASLSANASTFIANQNSVAAGCTKTTLHNGYGVKVVGIRCGTTTGPYLAVIQVGHGNVSFYNVAPGYTARAYRPISWSLYRN